MVRKKKFGVRCPGYLCELQPLIPVKNHQRFCRCPNCNSKLKINWKRGKSW